MKNIVLLVFVSFIFTFHVSAEEKIDSAISLCESSSGIYNQTNKTCTIKTQSIDADVLYTSYKEVESPKMYMGGSKYFDERTGYTNKISQKNDYDGYVFIKNNIPWIYKEYQTQLDSHIKHLGNALSINEVKVIEDTPNILGSKITIRLDTLAQKIIVKTNNLSHIESERYLIKRLQILDTIRNKYVERNQTGKYMIHIAIVEYLYKSIEAHVAYE